MFDPKPALQKYAGQRPDSVNLRTERMTGGLLPSPFKFQKYGQNGTEISELLPNLAGCVDELSVIRSMYTFNPTHTPARNLIHSGNIASTLPTLGAWLSYGLGNENENLPGFVVLSPEPGGFSGSSLWRSGFLPTKHQGTHFNHSETNPEKMIRYIQNNKLNAKIQRDQLDLLTSLNREHQLNIGEDAFLEARITEAQIKRFRQEVDGQGLSSYPHPWLMPDFWQFPTVSMGLGPIQAIYQARFMRYLQHREVIPTQDRKVWAFIGDGEMDEPESMGAIGVAGRDQLDNLIFVVNCNLQRHDGPVRGNSKIIQELEG